MCLGLLFCCVCGCLCDVYVVCAVVAVFVVVVVFAVAVACGCCFVVSGMRSGPNLYWRCHCASGPGPGKTC